jgi:hypothetical protein
MADQRPLRAIADRILGGEITKLDEAVELYGATAFSEFNTNEILKERLAELELALDDYGWQRLAAEGDREFSRSGLRTITKMCRLYWLKNPLVKRAVYTQTAYVFGQGVNITPQHKELEGVVDDFLDDPKNAAELTSHQARMVKETELQVEGNLFFVFFVNESTGHVRLRTIPFDEIEDIVTNPEDKKEPRYYVRSWVEGTTSKMAAYPDFRYNPERGHPSSLQLGDNKVPVVKQQVYHVKVNCLSDMKFGVSEVYAAVDWARAYKDFLEDWATIVRSLSRFAWQATSKAGAKGIQAVKDKLDSAISTTDTLGNLPPNAGSTFIANEAVKLETVTKSGTTTSVEDGRRLLLMVSAATGIFEHYFGDPSTGNLATASSMERPMELMFVDRQQLWKTIISDILQYAIDMSGLASNGILPGAVEWNDYDERTVTITIKDEGEEGNQGAGGPRGKELTDGPEYIERDINIDFPSILEKDVKAKVDAIVASTTLSGQAMAGTLDLPTVTRMLLVALGEDDVDEMMEQLFPDGEIPDDNPQALKTAAAQKLLQVQPEGEIPDGKDEDEEPPQKPNLPAQASATEAMIAEAIEELKSAASDFGKDI